MLCSHATGVVREVKMFDFRKKKNNEIKITGTFSYIDVEIDNKQIRILGEMGSGYFLCYEECITEWLMPEGQSITPEEKENLIERIIQKQKNSKMKIIFRDNKGNEYSRIISEEEKEKITDLIYSGIKIFMNEKKDLFAKEKLYVISYLFEKHNYTKPFSSFLYFNTEKHYQELILNADEDMLGYYKYCENEWEESASGTNKYFNELSDIIKSIYEKNENEINDSQVYECAIEAFIRLKNDQIVPEDVELILNARNCFEKSELIDAYIKINGHREHCDYIDKIKEFY